MVEEADETHARRDRRGRDRRAPDRRQRGGGRRGDRGAHRGPDRGHLRARKRPARVSRGAGRRSGLGDGSLVVFDTGGGSSQFTFGHGDAGRRAVQRRRRRRPVHRAVRARRRGVARGRSRRRWPRSRPTCPGSTAAPRPTPWSAMGGAVTNIDRGEARPRDRTTPTWCRGPSSTAPRSIARSSCYRIARRGRPARIVGLQPKRADVILAGACIVRTVMDALGRDRSRSSDRGLRHGLLVERFGADAAGTEEPMTPHGRSGRHRDRSEPPPEDEPPRLTDAAARRACSR